MGFFFFTTTTLLDIVYGQSTSHWQRLRVTSYCGFFLFNHEPTNNNGSTKWRSSFRPPSWAQSFRPTVHRLGLFTSVWGNLERSSQFDDVNMQMIAICYQEALQWNGCLDLLELQDTAQHLSWKTASTNAITFACYLAKKFEIRVKWDPFHLDLIASSPNANLAALACQDDDCFYYHSWRNNVVIAFGTLSSFLT